MLKQFNSALIQASTAYIANIIRSLFYLLMEILNLVTYFFLYSVALFVIFSYFRIFLLPPFLIFYFFSWFSLYLAFWYLFFALDFHGIYVVYITVYLRVILIHGFLTCNIWWSIILIFSFLYCLMDSFYSHISC